MPEQLYFADGSRVVGYFILPNVVGWWAFLPGGELANKGTLSTKAKALATLAAHGFGEQSGIAP